MGAVRNWEKESSFPIGYAVTPVEDSFFWSSLTGVRKGGKVVNNLSGKWRTRLWALQEFSFPTVVPLSSR